LGSPKANPLLMTFSFPNLMEDRGGKSIKVWCEPKACLRES
jgi:hypothetical protein